ncbi:MAG: C40 family peptidase [Bacteroidales bacterium]|nr:C40 family peptidase [Bacteroidales bacterium]
MKRTILILTAITVMLLGAIQAQAQYYLEVEYYMEEEYAPEGEPAPSHSRVDSVLMEANKYLGTPYRWGGKAPGGFDCAGFVRYVYSKFGVSLAPAAPPQYRQGSPVKRSDLRPGDLVFFGGSHNPQAIGHVGIVTSVGEDEFFFIHASNSGVRVSTSKETYYRHRYISACRVLE